ncbi:hypothetical protein [Nocardia suismassiliense]|uniref:hypothetical protein n=1 Tax=Nocardia suismassiliense TaxID=2077092 RepID=UPI00131EEE1E|nr:hypothetical protein [Nocardia suismassiliense]
MSEYEDAQCEFRRAVAAWNEAGEPQSGPLMDQLNAARERLVQAQPPEEPRKLRS